MGIQVFIHLQELIHHLLEPLYAVVVNNSTIMCRQVCNSKQAKQQWVITSHVYAISCDYREHLSKIMSLITIDYVDYCAVCS